MAWFAATVLVLCCVGAAVVAETAALCPEGCTCNLVRHVVECRDVGLTTIPWNLPDPSGLERLDLRGNRIQTIVAELVSYPNLRELDLSDNGLETIDDSVLAPLSALRRLRLSNNRLSAVRPATFRGLQSLIELDLGTNQISHLESGVFSDLVALEELILSRNRLGGILNGTGAFSGLTSLRRLVLSENELTSVGVLGQMSLLNLSELSLDNNRIRSVAPGSFSGLQELRVLSLSGNVIVDIPPNAFSALNSPRSSPLRRLTLRDNKLTSVPTASLRSLVDLEYLDISGNLLTLIDTDSLGDTLTRLQSLDISAMPQLQTIGRRAFSKVPALRQLSAHTNPSLRTVENSAFAGVVQLRSLDLHAGNLGSLTAQMLSWRTLEHLDLRFNPWNCDCRLGWLRDVLRQSSVSKSAHNGLLLNEVRCSAPASVVGRRIIELTDADFNCHSTSEPVDAEPQADDKVLIATICGFAGLLVLAAVLVLVKYRKSFANMPVTVVGHAYSSAEYPHACKKPRPILRRTPPPATAPSPQVEGQAGQLAQDKLNRQRKRSVHFRDADSVIGAEPASNVPCLSHTDDDLPPPYDNIQHDNIQHV